MLNFFGVISCLASVATMALASAAASLHVGTCYPSFSAQGLGTVYVIKAGYSYRCPTARHWHSLTSLLRVLLSGTIRGSGSLLALLDGWRRVQNMALASPRVPQHPQVPWRQNASSMAGNALTAGYPVSYQVLHNPKVYTLNPKLQNPKPRKSSTQTHQTQRLKQPNPTINC